MLRYPAGIIGIGAWAQVLTGDLIVVSETGEPFRLYLNGEWIAEAPVTRAEAHDLHGGPQKATFYIHPAEGRVIQLKRTLHVEEGYVEYYAIRKKNKEYKVVLFNRTQKEATPPPPASTCSPGPAAGGTPGPRPAAGSGPRGGGLGV
ncbi:MAG: hypothetical protein RMJ66_07540, partial [Bacteroidia bacterium]|nr:hypothetical protein [Bacteroidia bacterium]MDW8134907.1 hypothetical protein [Bacteroidia bacterium]